MHAIKSPGMVTRRASLDTLLATNPVAAWLDERCVHEPGAALAIGTVRRDGSEIIDTDALAYPNHVEWCEGHGHRAASTVRFTGLVTDLARSHIDAGIARDKDSRNRSVITGLRLRKPTDTGPGCLFAALAPGGSGTKFPGRAQGDDAAENDIGELI